MLTAGALSCKIPPVPASSHTRTPGDVMPAATFFRLPLVVTCALFVVVASRAVRAADGSATVDYAREVKPLLAGKCYACHGALKHEGSLRLDTREFVLRGGDGGAAIVPGDAGRSLLLARLTAPIDERMPPEGEGEALRPAELELLRRWIEQGAPGMPNERAEADPRTHWAFRPPTAPPVPKVQDPAWQENPIDAFIALEHERRGLKPVAEADPALLLRRLHFDLVGLPPTASATTSGSVSPSLHLPLSPFGREAKESGSEGEWEQEYLRTVDLLLASPQYGQRWGRHWMDVWRYSDWWGLGAEVRNSQKHIWHWRDWIVESLNDDVGYDEMVRQMLAADELYPTDARRLRAGGFLARSYFKFSRTTWLDGVVEHTGKALLGLTLNCGKCHDHKYDPFTQLDYYRLRAVFEPYQLRTDQVPGRIDFEQDGIPRPFDCNLDAPTFVHLRGNDTQPLKDRPLSAEVPDFLEFAPFKIEPVALPREAYLPSLRPFVIDDHLRDAEAKIAAAKAEVAKAGDDRSDAARRAAEAALAAAQRLPETLRNRAAATRAQVFEPNAPATAKLCEAAARAERALTLARAEADLARSLADLAKADDKSRPDVEKRRTAAQTAVDAARKALEKPGLAFTPFVGSLKTPESNVESEASRHRPFPATSTGRRTALARWITDVRHPLTARVAVNHIWARHFGTPLVPTVFDFGRKGKPPTHPELLDWLAVELMEPSIASEGRTPPAPWSMKHVLRLIVLSSTYRQSSKLTPEAAERDDRNLLYARGPRLRLDAEAIRDNALAIAGLLSKKQFGPPIKPPQPDGLWTKVGGERYEYVVSPGEDKYRRGLYVVWKRGSPYPSFINFDASQRTACTVKRSRSNTPLQALTLLNDPVYVEAAQALARRVVAERPAPDADERLSYAFRLCTARPPNARELAVLQRLYADERAAHGAANDADDRAWYAVATALLNLDETITKE